MVCQALTMVFGTMAVQAALLLVQMVWRRCRRGDLGYHRKVQLTAFGGTPSTPTSPQPPVATAYGDGASSRQVLVPFDPCGVEVQIKEVLELDESFADSKAETVLAHKLNHSCADSKVETVLALKLDESFADSKVETVCS